MLKRIDEQGFILTYFNNNLGNNSKIAISPKNYANSLPNRFYSQTHFDMLNTEKSFNSNGISRYFGISKYLCIEPKILKPDEKIKENIDDLLKTILSALQIVSSNHNIKLPVFVKNWNSKFSIPIISGYLSYYSIFTGFNTRIFADFHNGATKYSTLYKILFDGVNTYKLFNQFEDRFDCTTAFYHYYTKNLDNKKYFLNDDIISNISFISQKNSYYEDTKIKNPQNIWGNFVKDSDLISIKCDLKDDKINKISNKMTNCLNKISEFHKKKQDLQKSMQSSIMEVTKLDPKQIADYQFIREVSEIEFKKLCNNAIQSMKKPKILLKLQPCCIFSFYGILLKNIYNAENLENAIQIWIHYIQILRSDWENSKTFKLYFF